MDGNWFVWVWSWRHGHVSQSRRASNASLVKRPKIGLRLDPAAAAERNPPAVALTLSNDDIMQHGENMRERTTKRGKRGGRAKRVGVGCGGSIRTICGHAFQTKNNGGTLEEVICRWWQDVDEAERKVWRKAAGK